VNGKGEVIRLSEKDGDDFSLAVVGLGGFGVVTGVTLKVLPAFQMRQWVWEEMPFERFVNDFDRITKAGYSVSGFTTWRSDTVSEVWVKRRAADGDWPYGTEWLGAKPAPNDRHPIITMDPSPCTPQMGVVRPAWEIMPHFRPDRPPSSAGHERHSEYSVPEKDAAAAMRAIHAIGDRIFKALQISEIRTVAADNLALSMAYRRASVMLHFTWTENDADVAAAIPIVEEALRPFKPRPHWGKLTQLSAAELRANVPRLRDFRRFCEKHDPEGKFRNPFLDRSVFVD
jgi:xylitol oxidase